MKKMAHDYTDYVKSILLDALKKELKEQRQYLESYRQSAKIEQLENAVLRIKRIRKFY